MKDGIGNATESIKGKFASLKDSIAEKSEGIRSSVSNAWNNAKNAVGSAWDGLVANCKKGVDQTGSLTGGLVWGMAATFGGLANSALTWGSDMIQNFINGIQQMWNALKNKVKGVAKLISDYLHFSEPKKGPLSDFNESGGDMMKNFATGIKNAQYLVRNAVSDVALDIQSQLGEPLDYDRIYGAVRDGASSATTKIVLNNREVTRALGGMGVVING
jgi:phage-related protein